MSTPVTPPLLRRLAAEALGTFGLVAVGTGAIVLEGGRGGWLGALAVSLCFGLVVVAMVLLFGRASGAHINPAVTLAAASTGQLPRRDVLPYVLAQCAGALAGSFVVAACVDAPSSLGATVPAVSRPLAFALELALTGLLVFVILRLVFRPGSTLTSVAWGVGATVATLAFLGGPATGASMNPARSLGPALAGGRLDDLWLYLVAPAVGALLAVRLCRRSVVDCCVGSSEPCR